MLVTYGVSCDVNTELIFGEAKFIIKKQDVDHVESK